MIEIDPLEALLNLAKADSGLNDATTGQIDNRHRYGQDTGDWELNSPSLIFTPTGGPSQLYVEVQKVQLEARCYGDTPYDAGLIARKLVDFARVNQRRTVQVTEGKALVYYAVIRGQTRLDFDEEIRPNGGMPFYSVQLEAEVSELTVT